MESLIFELLTNYGFDGILLAVILIIIWKFDKRLELRDNQENEFKGKVLEVVTENTRASTELAQLIKDRIR